MNWTKKLTEAGEHHLMLHGEVGLLESILAIPKEHESQTLVIIGHPHSLHGGTMRNKVVSTVARACDMLNVYSLRFNFRGVGASAGEYDAGIGESLDMLRLANEWRHTYPQARIVFVGFSFGSYVAYRAAAQFSHESLITIAPAVTHYDYTEFANKPSPWVILQGREDEVIPFSEVEQFAKNVAPNATFIAFDETGHFFHKKLLELRAALLQALQPVIS